ncbi:MAG: alpha/beta fold hydrolase [Patescibacteria group bacterium]|nr:alpha/beta fold hydrolase [Patescibacteria group bacterium]
MKIKFKKKISAAIIITMSIVVIVGLADISFLFRSEHQGNLIKSKYPIMKKVSFVTADDKKINADYYIVDKNKYTNPKGWLVLTHMMPAVKESWEDLANELQVEEYESLAIDLRGHGESAEGSDGFVNFSDKEHRNSINDLKAAISFLKDNGAEPEKIFFIGASIGANLSLQYVSENEDAKIVVLLSPGINYRGIKAEAPARKLRLNQKALIISSEDDEGNDNEAKKIFESIPENVQKELKIYKTGGHGTDILTGQPDLKNVIINFINKWK